MPESIFQTRSGETDGLTVCFAVFLVSDTKHTVMKRSACCDILYQNIHFLFILCSLSRQLSGNVSDQGRYASSNSGWFR